MSKIFYIVIFTNFYTSIGQSLYVSHGTHFFFFFFWYFGSNVKMNAQLSLVTQLID